MILFGNPVTWLVWGLTWLVLMLVVSAAMSLVARGGE